MNLFSLSAQLALDTAEFESGVQRSEATMQGLATKAVAAGQALEDKLKGGADEAAASASNLANEADKSKTGFDFMAAKAVAAGQALERAFEKAVSIAKSIAETGIAYNAQVESYEMALTNMLGSAEEAAAVMDQIKADAASTPFDTASLVQANQLLISTGISATDARNTIMALGDAVAATGGGSAELSRMAQNLQQIQNVGKATAMDIRQFAMAGIDIYGILADYTGKSTAEVQQLDVSYKLLSSALQAASKEGGRYFNSMATQSQTLNGRLSTLRDNATQLAGAMTQGLTNSFKNAVTVANSVVVKLISLQDAFRVLHPLVTGLTTAAGTLAITLNMSAIITATTNAMAAAKKAMVTLRAATLAVNAAMAANPYAVVAAAIAGVTAALVAAYKTNDTFRSRVNAAWSAVYNHVAPIINAIGNGINKLAQFLGLAKEASKVDIGPAASGIEGFNDVVDKAEVNTFRLNNALKNVKPAADTAVVSLGNVGSGLASVGKSAGSAGGKATAAAEQAAKSAAKVVAAVTDTFTESVNGAERIIQRLTETYDDGTMHITDKVTETAKTIVNGVERNKETVTTIVDGVTQKVETALTDIAEAEKTIVSVLTDTTTQELEETVRSVQRMVETYSDGSKRIVEKVTETGTTIVDGVERNSETVTTIVDGAVEKVETSLTDMEAKVEETVPPMISNLKELGKDLLNTFTEARKGGSDVEALTTTFGRLNSRITASSDTIQSICGVIARLATQEGAAAIQTGILTTAQTLQTAVTGGATAAWGAFNAVLDMNPIIAVISVIGLLTGAVLKLSRGTGDLAATSDDATGRMLSGWTKVKDTLEWVMYGISSLFYAEMRRIAFLVDGFVNVAIGAWNLLAPIFGGKKMEYSPVGSWVKENLKPEKPGGTSAETGTGSTNTSTMLNSAISGTGIESTGKGENGGESGNGQRPITIIVNVDTGGEPVTAAGIVRESVWAVKKELLTGGFA